MGYLRHKIRNWLFRHPHLRALYIQNTFRMITSPLRVLPDFAIIGARKSGTSSLYAYLTRHPAIRRASEKEPRYFSTQHQLGRLWYRSCFPTNLSRYRFGRRTGQRLLSGEASVSYLDHPLAPVRMREVLPNIRLVVILRNPVDRTYSHYHYMVSHMKTEMRSFEDAIKGEEEGPVWGGQQIKNADFGTYSYDQHAYLSGSIYADYLEHWFRYYSRKQFLILTTEDLGKDPEQVMSQVFGFLGVAPQPGYAKNLRKINVGNYKEMGEDTRRFLIEHFRPHNERLSKLLQRSFDWDR